MKISSCNMEWKRRRKYFHSSSLSDDDDDGVDELNHEVSVVKVVIY